jgi:DNA-directed RNA polymerase subunit beta
LNAAGQVVDLKDAEDDDEADSTNELGFNIGAKPDAGASMPADELSY